MLRSHVCFPQNFLQAALIALWLGTPILSTPCLANLGNDRYGLAADEQRLWLIERGPRESRCFTRTVENPDELEVLNINGSLAQAVAVEDGLIVLFDDHRLFEFSANREWTPIRQLGQRKRPVRLSSQANVVFAVIDQQAALGIPFLIKPPGLSGILWHSTIELLPANWWLVQRVPTGWRKVGPTYLPSGTSETNRRAPAYVKTDASDLFAVRNSEGNTITTVEIPHDGSAAAIKQLSVTGARKEWLIELNYQYFLLVASNDPTADSLQLYHYEKNEAARWKPLSFSLPELAVRDITRVIDAISFNQHLAILIEDRAEKLRLIFWRPNGNPTEQAFDVTERITQRDQLASRGVTIHMLATIAPLTLLGLTLVFRNNVLRMLPPISSTYSLALFSQRLAAAMIDLLPFVWAMAFTLKLEVVTAFGDLLEWSFAGAESDLVAPSKLLIWWASSLVSYSVYMAIMESLTGRSVGKVITRTQVLTTTLEKPHWKIILLRNLTRPLELLPPWPLVIVVVLTLKRQRIGDIWAGTMVVTTRSGDSKPPDRTTSFDKSEPEENPPEVPKDDVKK